MSDQFSDPHPQEDLFEVKLNATGKFYIQKFASLARVSVGLGVLVTLVSATITIIRLIKVGRPVSIGDGFLGVINSVYPYYSMVHAVIFCLLLYYYGKAAKCLKKGIDYSNDELFNQSFPALYRSTLLAVINFSLTLIVDAPYFIWVIKYYL